MTRGDNEQSLVTADPSRYFVPPYVGGRGWLGIYLDLEERGEGQVDWAAVEDHVEAAYRVIAPKTLVALLDDET